MPLFGRRPAPQPLPLERPRLDGAGWPDAPGLGRPSFEVSTRYEVGNRRAHDPDALGLAERLLDAALPLLRLQVAQEDAPYLRNLLLTAARVGAGLGLLTSGPPGTVDRATAGALWLARRALPAMPPDRERVAAWLLLAGHWAARTDVAPHAVAVGRLLEDLPRT